MDVEQELLPLLKQLAEGVLKQRLAIQDLVRRVERLEHVLANMPPEQIDAIAHIAVPD